MPGSQDPRILSSCFTFLLSLSSLHLFLFLDAFLKPAVFHIFWSWVEKCTTRWIKKFINYRASQAGLGNALERTWFHRLKGYCDFCCQWYSCCSAAVAVTAPGVLVAARAVPCCLNQQSNQTVTVAGRSCKQSGRAFTFTHAFPLWSMPMCRA